MPIGKLIISMSLPMMISFFIQAMYNIVDSMFVAKISENALTAVSLAFPMQQVMHAISVGLSVGISAVIPHFLGMGNKDKANRTAGAGFFLNAVFVIVFLIMGLTLPGFLYGIQTDVTEIVNDGTIYLTICWAVCLGEFFGQYYEKLLVSTGRAALAMVSQASGAVFNIVFDPLLIFGIGPFPKMGIAGAALATVLGQILGAFIAMMMNRHFNHTIQLKMNMIRPDMEAFREIFAVGVPSMITIGLSSATTFCVNQILLGYSTTATAVYGIWMKLQNFSFMPVFGMNNGMIPILSYNNSCGENRRVLKAIRIALTAIVSYLVLLACILEFVPEGLLGLFSASGNMLSIGVTALRICVLSLPFGGACIIMTTTMQSLLHSRYALAVNILRQFVIIVGLFSLISAATGTLQLVWLAVPCTEILSVCIASALEFKMLKDLKKQPIRN
jgi:putative MATE family efflux protein